MRGRNLTQQLLQFVTNTLLAERTAGISIKTALTRHDELEVTEMRRIDDAADAKCDRRTRAPD